MYGMISMPNQSTLIIPYMYRKLYQHTQKVEVI
jgi:hypothetical protein